MVTLFDKARVEVEIKYVLIGRCVAEDDTAKVATIKCASTVARAFHAYSRPKQFEVGKIWFEAIVSLKRSFPSFRVDEPIVKVDRV
jgi:hypothetical protein